MYFRMEKKGLNGQRVQLLDDLFPPCKRIGLAQKKFGTEELAGLAV